MIFIERDHPLSKDEIEEKLELLRKALQSHSNRIEKNADAKALKYISSAGLRVFLMAVKKLGEESVLVL